VQQSLSEITALPVAHIAALFCLLANRMLQSCCFNSGSRQRSTNRRTLLDRIDTNLKTKGLPTSSLLHVKMLTPAKMVQDLGSTLHWKLRVHQDELIVSTMEETSFTFRMFISA
jgi:hypothetical protein